MIEKETFDDILANDQSSESWVVAYADMITLLFVFFVLLLSVSQMSRAKMDMLNQQFNSQTTTSLSELKNNLDSEISKSNLKDSVSTKFGREGLEIHFSEKVLFNSGRAEMEKEGGTILGRFSEILAKMPENFSLAVEGHTDSIPIHNGLFASNWSLSAMRAVTVIHTMVNQGVDHKRMTLRAFADTQPIDFKGSNTKEDEKWRALNRRVTILVY